jgi:hypothetical protein
MFIRDARQFPRKVTTMLSLNILTNLLDGPCRAYQDGRSFQIMWAASSCPAREINPFAMSTAMIVTESPEAAENMLRGDSVRELSLMAGMGVPLTMFSTVEDLLELAGEAAYDAGWFETWWREDVCDEVSYALSTARHLQLLRPRFGMARVQVQQEEKEDLKQRRRSKQQQQQLTDDAQELLMLTECDGRPEECMALYSRLHAEWDRVMCRTSTTGPVQSRHPHAQH